MEPGEVHGGGADGGARFGQNGIDADGTEQGALARHIRTADDVEAIRDVERDVVADAG